MWAQHPLLRGWAMKSSEDNKKTCKDWVFFPESNTSDWQVSQYRYFILHHLMGEKNLHPYYKNFSKFNRPTDFLLAFLINAWHI